MRRRSIMSNSLRICTAAVVTALLGVLAGGAIAGIRPDDRSGARGTDLAAQASYPDAVDRAVANHKAHVLRPDDRSEVRGPGLPTKLSPDAVDRAVANHRADLERQAMVHTYQRPNVTESTGFDWGAAGVGASTISALLLLAGCGVALIRRATRKRRAFSGVQ